ncbi:YodL domain-containing protein [Lachnospiraceae bacterium NSJ-143]|nr:YodL domain-containing protein [Lachnospiraceae bacterium NSJ-143]
MAYQKQPPGDRLKEITDQLEKGLQDLFSSEKYADYLKTMSKFYGYSASNTLLIYMQRPDASRVAGYGDWQKNFHRHVKRGEHGIKILAPCPYKQQVEREQTRPDGKTVTVTEEVTRAAFKPVTVFDVSQTEGEPLPTLGVNELTGDVEHYPDFFEALKQVAPFPVGFEAITSGAKGYCNYAEQRIAIHEGMAEVQNVKTAIHEITHATLHNYYAEKEKEVPPEQRKDQRTREVEAESVAYTVCQHYGIDTSDYSFGYIAGWSSDKQTKELKASLGTIRNTAAALITAIDEKYQEIVKAKEQEQEQAAPAMEAPEQDAPGLTEPDTFTIYQLKHGDDLHYHRFEPLERLQAAGLSVESVNYDLIYTAPLQKSDTLEGIYTRFNIDRPEDFKGHSLSVSDVVVLHQNGSDRAFYVDSFGFSEVPQFLEQQRAAEKENPLAAAEMSSEQNYNMIDGIINNQPFMPDATMNERANALIDLVEQDGQRFGDGERRLIVEYAEQVQDNEKLFALVNELAEQGFEQKNHYVNPAIVERTDAEIAAAKARAMIGGPLDPSIQPIVTIIWSESDKLRDGQQMTLAEADDLFKQLDAAHGPGYDKTEFRIDFTFQGELDSYEGRQDFGDGDGGLIDHINSYQEYYAHDESWKNHILHNDGPEALEQDTAHREMILTEFVPYLRLHCNLSEMERAATDALAAVVKIEEPDGIDRTNAAYYAARQSYVTECRGQLNSGNYEMPEAPKKEDFIDPELRAYQKQAREEVEQEARDAGMTVEEYAANDYMPRPVVEMRSACHSNYTGMVAMVGADDKVYMGKAENYDNKGHYDNRDSSLCFISENTGIYPFLYGEGWVKSQAEMLDNGLTLDEYKEFAELQQGILSRFEQRRELLFDGQPFDPLFSSQPVQEQANAPAAEAVETPTEEQPEGGYEQLSFSQLIQEQTDAPAAVTVETPAPTKEAPEASATGDDKTTAPTYYAINETTARRAKEAISFSDYRPGSATSEYRQMVDEAAQIAERQKKRIDPMHHEKIDRLLDTYCRKLAANMNHHNEILGRVPSVMIAGPSNFPVRKKEKQNAAMDSNMREWRDIQGLLDKIRSTGMGGISADDPEAVAKLQAKLDNLVESQETMKAVNAYYRKHKTLDGCPHLPPQTLEKLKADMAQGWHLEDKPFASWALSNNNAEIHRVKARIESLTRKEQTPFVGWEFDGGKVEINREENRLQVFFDGKPDADTRAELKGGGFRWSPNAKAWQRQLTDNAFRAADSIKAIAPLTGEKPTELQRKARREKPSIREQLDAAKSAPAPKQEAKTAKKKEKEIEL